MNKTILLITTIICITFGLYAQTSVTRDAGYNFSSFTAEKKIINSELQLLTDEKFSHHPEYGVLPYNAPCKDCFELLQKRDETHRYFVKNGSSGKEFYQQSAYSSLSYNDNGVLRTIDHRMKPSAQSGVFEASQQPFPVAINIPEKFASILKDGIELRVNRDVSIFIMHSDGSVTSLGQPDWSNYTAGDNGVVVTNFYPGIDLELLAGTGSIESFYRINKPLQLTDGWLVIRDNMMVPQGFAYDYSHCEKLINNFYEGSLFINDAQGAAYCMIGSPVAQDENGNADNAINLNYRLADNGVFDLYVPVNWMNDDKRSYPLVIDPLVSVTSSLPSANIESTYDPTCFINGCPYDLNVIVPPACTITDLTTTFWFQALGTCTLKQGAWDLTYAGCHYPSAAPGIITCNIQLAGACQLTGINCFYDIKTCLPPPVCASTSLPFTLNFYRCTTPGAACAFSCITHDINFSTPWSITLTGMQDSVHLASITASGPTAFCKGDSVILTSSAGTSYSWSTGDTTPSIKAFSSGYYGVNVIDTIAKCATIQVAVDSLPVATSNSPVCPGRPFYLHASSGSAYSWSGPNGFSSQIYNPAVVASSITAGTYTVTVTNNCGTNTATTSVRMTNDYLSGFSFVQSGLDAIFTSDSAAMVSHLWTFGDGATDTLINPIHQYAAAGTYNVCLSAGGGCPSVTCDTVSFKGLTAINTNHGGNNGAVTVNITGGGFTQGMKFFLHKSGEQDIAGDTLIIRNKGLMTTGLDLTGKSLGLWDVVVVFPLGDTLTLIKGFSIEHALNTNLWVTLTGDYILRIGFNQVYTLNFGNKGNEDAVYVPLLISGLPGGTDIEIKQSLLDVKQLPGFNTLLNQSDTIPSSLYDKQTNTSYRLFYIGKIPAGYTGTLSFIFHVPDSTVLHTYPVIKIQLGEPLFDSKGAVWSSNMNTTIGSCDQSMGLNIAGDAVDALHINDWNNCVTTLDSTLLSMVVGCKDSSKVNQGNTGATSIVVGGPDMNEGLAAALIKCAGTAGATILKAKEDLTREICSSVYGQLKNNTTVNQCFGVYRENANCIFKPIIGNATDPNQKFGPGGGSAGHFISADGYMGYTITFENDSNSNLPAQKVIVTDTLKATYYDFNSFLFTSVTVGDSAFALPCPNTSFIHDFDFRLTMGVKARVAASFDASSGIAKWTFYSIDTPTNQVTTNALAGFLPPDKISPQGQGYVSFIVKSKASIQTGDTIYNRAQIIFDNNPPIYTDSWQNVFDLVKPQSAVYGLTPFQADTMFSVKWHGNDDFSGIRDYTIYVSDNGSGYYPWITTSDTAAMFKGLVGHNYALYSIATDSAGNVEDAPASPDQTTIITGIEQINTVFDFNVNLFPNPNNGSFTLDIFSAQKNHAKLTLLDVLGKNLLNKELVLVRGTNTFAIDRSNLAGGVYFLQLSTNKGSWMGRFVKE